jgi:hypothetical protein
MSRAAFDSDKSSLPVVAVQPVGQLRVVVWRTKGCSSARSLFRYEPVRRRA